MPTYVYRCLGCGRVIERRLKIKDRVKKAPRCMCSGQPVKARQVPAVFSFKMG